MVTTTQDVVLFLIAAPPDTMAQRRRFPAASDFPASASADCSLFDEPKLPPLRPDHVPDVFTFQHDVAGFCPTEVQLAHTAMTIVLRENISVFFRETRRLLTGEKEPATSDRDCTSSLRNVLTSSQKLFVTVAGLTSVAFGRSSFIECD
jgi:hypothetical protein